MYAAIGGRRIVDARVVMPRIGVWHADLTVDAAEAVTGKQAISIADSVRLSGTVIRSGVIGGRVSLRMVGGAAGMGTLLRPKFYRGVTARIVLADIAREAGEALSAGIASGLLSRMLPKWVRMAGSASEALLVLATTLGVGWRIESDGALWLGNETWPPFDTEHDVIGGSSSDGVHEVAMVAPKLVPGVEFRGHRVSAVEHTLGSGKVRSRYWVEQ